MTEPCAICCGRTLKVSGLLNTDIIILDLEGWGLSPRGAGYLFGGDVVAQVLFNISSQN